VGCKSQKKKKQAISVQAEEDTARPALEIGTFLPPVNYI
jgi:hypothetical protein